MNEPVSTVWKVLSATAAPLVERAKAGDQDAFQELVKMYGNAVNWRLRDLLGLLKSRRDADVMDETSSRATACDADVEDLYQKTFLTAWKLLCRGRYKEKRRVHAWLFRIAERHVKNWRKLKWNKEKVSLTFDEEGDIEQQADALLKTMDDLKGPWDAFVILEKIFEKLPRGGPALLKDRYIDGWKPSDKERNKADYCLRKAKAIWERLKMRGKW